MGLDGCLLTGRRYRPVSVYKARYARIAHFRRSGEGSLRSSPWPGGPAARFLQWTLALGRQLPSSRSRQQHCHFADNIGGRRHAIFCPQCRL